MKGIKKKSVLVLVLMTFVIVSINAKDSTGLGFQFGAMGAEKTFYSSETISLPYTKTTFNPCVNILLCIPVCDINENCFFGLDLGYNFSWTSSYTSYNSSQTKICNFSHRLFLMPELVYKKSSFRIFAGTGLALGIDSHTYESKVDGIYDSDEYSHYKLFWTYNVGLKYKLGEHISAIADLTFFADMFDTYTNDGYKSEESGSNTMEVLPKIGLMYQF